jgi:hypothetical protein
MRIATRYTSTCIATSRVWFWFAFALGVLSNAALQENPAADDCMHVIIGRLVPLQVTGIVPSATSAPAGLICSISFANALYLGLSLSPVFQGCTM